MNQQNSLEFRQFISDRSQHNVYQIGYLQEHPNNWSIYITFWGLIQILTSESHNYLTYYFVRKILPLKLQTITVLTGCLLDQRHTFVSNVQNYGNTGIINIYLLFSNISLGLELETSSFQFNSQFLSNTHILYHIPPFLPKLKMDISMQFCLLESIWKTILLFQCIMEICIGHMCH